MNPKVFGVPTKIWKILFLALPMVLPVVVSNQYYVHGILGRILVYTILVASLDVVVGYIGDISIGHAALFAIGAYTTAILTADPRINQGATMLYLPQLPFFIALAAGTLLAAGAGLVLGFPSLRASGPYLAVSTIACGLIIQTIINEQETITNGTKGIHLTPLQLGGVSLDGNQFIWLVYPILVLVILAKNELGRSFWGRAFEAIKHSTLAAEASGISRTKYKISAFVLSSGLAGLAGGLFTQLDHYIAANTFTLEFSILALMALIFGGVRSSFGNFLGMAMVVILPDLFTAFKDYRLLVFGCLLLLTLFFLPNGVAGLFSLLVKKGIRRWLPSLTATPKLLNTSTLSAAELRSWLVPTGVASQAPLLSLRGVGKRFGGLQAVDDLTMDLRAGVIHGLMGPNGSGKSTTVNLISGVYEASAGSLIWNLGTKSIANWATFRRSQLGIARTFQNLQLFGELTVLENVLVGFHSSFRSSLIQVLLRTPAVRKQEQQFRMQALSLLQMFGLAELAEHSASSLAYGQARRLEIARALASRPRLLLLDEPAAGLTSGEIEEFNQIFLRIKDYGIGILLIEHHMDMLMKISDEITVLDFGKVIATGAPELIQKNPRVIAAYLGSEAGEL